jgi:hypothetical protein
MLHLVTALGVIKLGFCGGKDTPFFVIKRRFRTKSMLALRFFNQEGTSSYGTLSECHMQQQNEVICGIGV